jgi:hypothetical protein
VAAHTPGPWRVLLDSLRVGRNSDFAPTVLVIADCRGSTGVSVAESQANARLIAAAPALLEALRAILALDVYADGYSAALERAEAAVQEATT